jgi:hypothetical protein
MQQHHSQPDLPSAEHTRSILVSASAQLTPASTLVISSTRIPSNGAIFPGEGADEETEARHLRRVKDGVVEAACAHSRWPRKTLLSALLGAIVEKRGTIGTGE